MPLIQHNFLTSSRSILGDFQPPSPARRTRLLAILRASALAIIAFSALAGPARGADHPPPAGPRGVVVGSRCGSHFFVSTQRGYAVLTWLGGGVAMADDVVSGGLEREGRARLVDQTNGEQIDVVVETALLSQTAYFRRLSTLCRR